MGRAEGRRQPAREKETSKQRGAWWRGNMGSTTGWRPGAYTVRSVEGDEESTERSAMPALHRMPSPAAPCSTPGAAVRPRGPQEKPALGAHHHRRRQRIALDQRSTHRDIHRDHVPLLELDDDGLPRLHLHRPPRAVRRRVNTDSDPSLAASVFFGEPPGRRQTTLPGIGSFCALP